MPAFPLALSSPPEQTGTSPTPRVVPNLNCQPTQERRTFPVGIPQCPQGSPDPCGGENRWSLRTASSCPPFFLSLCGPPAQ